MLQYNNFLILKYTQKYVSFSQFSTNVNLRFFLEEKSFLRKENSKKNKKKFLPFGVINLVL